ncbi:MAG: YggT family protein [Clostridia bacterium]|nr:YggT family protein [Clostridia bacterium]
MNDFALFFCQAVDIFLQAIIWLYLVRCVLNLLGADEEMPLMFFAVAMTEVFILPMRIIFDKLGWSDNMMIDIPGMLTMFTLSTVYMVFL